jgi:hypothetical protein
MMVVLMVTVQIVTTTYHITKTDPESEVEVAAATMMTIIFRLCQFQLDEQRSILLKMLPPLLLEHRLREASAEANFTVPLQACPRNN